jgi:hypothetical protein
MPRFTHPKVIHQSIRSQPDAYVSRVVYLSPGWRRDSFRFKNSPKEYTASFHLHTFREDLREGEADCRPLESGSGATLSWSFAFHHCPSTGPQLHEMMSAL